MSTPTDIYEIAREGKRLRERATGGKWSWEPAYKFGEHHVGPTVYASRGLLGDGIFHGLNLFGRMDVDTNGDANLDFVCHAANNYAALCSAVLAAREEREEAKADREAMIEALGALDASEKDWTPYKSWSEVALDYSEEIKKRRAAEAALSESQAALAAAEKRNDDRADWIQRYAETERLTRQAMGAHTNAVACPDDCGCLSKPLDVLVAERLAAAKARGAEVEK